MITASEALEKILEHAAPRPEEARPLLEAAGRFLARDLVATSDSPRFDNSAVDGYAVRAAELEDASVAAPRSLRLLGTVAAGNPWVGELPPGHTLKTMTGAPLAAGADAMVMREDVRVEGEHVVFSRSCRVGEHVRRRSGDYRTGEALLPAGTRVTPPVAALLASMGRTCVEVRATPRVVLLTTGSEIVAPGSPLGPGQIYDANGVGLLAALAVLGIQPQAVGRYPDDADALRETFRDAFCTADVVLTTGGVSVGDFDHVREAAIAAGLNALFWRVALKPGKPVFFGTFPRPEVPAGLFFGLSGNPVGALLSFETLVRPALERMLGARRVRESRTTARLASAVTKAAGRLELVRGRLAWSGTDLEATPLAARDSHQILGLALADCLIHLPLEVEVVEEGATVDVSWLRWT